MGHKRAAQLQRLHDAYRIALVCHAFSRRLRLSKGASVLSKGDSVCQKAPAFWRRLHER